MIYHCVWGICVRLRLISKSEILLETASTIANPKLDLSGIENLKMKTYVSPVKRLDNYFHLLKLKPSTLKSHNSQVQRNNCPSKVSCFL